LKYPDRLSALPAGGGARQIPKDHEEHSALLGSTDIGNTDGSSPRRKD
jgi:hypothetical protein